MNRPVLSLVLLLAALAGDASAQTARAMGPVMCACPGRHMQLGAASSCSVACFGGGGGGAAGSQQQLAQQVGGLLGELLREALFGNPQQEARRRAEEQALGEELLRMAEAEERRKEAMKDRLLAVMIGVRPAPALSPMIDSRPALQPIIGDAATARATTLAEIPASSAMAQLTRAAYISGMVQNARSDEEAWALADAAFNATIGVQVDFPLPPTTPALAVRDADMARIESVRNRYRDATDRTHDSLAKVAETEQQRELARRVEQEARLRLAEAERNAAGANAANRRARREELTRARQIAEEAKALLNRLDSQFAAQQAAARALEVNIQASTDATLDLLLAFAGQRDGIAAAPERQPDKNSYLRGIMDASVCLQRTPSYCGILAGPVKLQCEVNYENGFRIGERARENNLREAHRIGAQAKQNGASSFLGFNHPKSSGPCRIRWLEAFNSGYGGAPFTAIGR